MGHDVSALIRQGRYLALDVAQLLSQFMVTACPTTRSFPRYWAV